MTHAPILPAGSDHIPFAVRFGRALAVGAEAVAALIIIAGGCGLVGIATLI